mgnify:CR=1 FL=1
MIITEKLDLAIKLKETGTTYGAYAVEHDKKILYKHSNHVKMEKILYK